MAEDKPDLAIKLAGPRGFCAGVDRPPGECVLIPGNTPHAIWTGDHMVLLVWAWFGDIQGPFEYLG